MAKVNCPFADMPEHLHDVSHQALDEITKEVKNHVHTLTPEQLESLWQSTIVVTFIEFTLLPDAEGNAISGTIGMVGCVHVDADRVEQAINHCIQKEREHPEKIDKESRHLPPGEFAGRIAMGAMAAVIINDLFGVDVDHPVPPDHPMTKLAQASGDMDKLSSTAEVMDLIGRQDKVGTHLPNWALSLLTFGGDKALKRLRETLADRRTFMLTGYFKFDRILVNGERVWASDATIRAGGLPRNVVLWDVMGSSPN